MSRNIFPRAVLVAIVAALALVPGTSLGAKPLEQFHEHVTDSFTDEICGIEADFDVVLAHSFTLFADESFLDRASFRATVTNPTNGNSIVLSNAGLVSGNAVIDEEAGTITFFTSFKGLPEKIQTAHGPILLRDAGFVTFADTFDLETGDFISSDVTFLAGPHPELESEFQLFCEIVTDALE